MLVSHRHRFIYTKTVKTAGSSIESYFEPFCMPEGEWALAEHHNGYETSAGIVGFRGFGRPDVHKWWAHMPAHKIRD